VFDADAATAEAERLINSENVIGIMGPNCSGVTTAVVNNVTAPLGVVNISPSATSPALSTIEDNGFFFRTAPSDARQGEVLATIAMSKGITQVAVTHGNSDYGKGLADAFIASYTALGGEVTASAAHEANKADYSADVAALSAAGSSTLAVFGYVEGGGTSVVTAALDTGAFDNFIFADGMIGDTLTNAGGALLNGSWGTMPGGGGAAADKWTAVGEAGGVAMGGPFLGESYDAMALIILAAQAADSPKKGPPIATPPASPTAVHLSAAAPPPPGIVPHEPLRRAPPAFVNVSPIMPSAKIKLSKAPVSSAAVTTLVPPPSTYPNTARVEDPAADNAATSAE
jgi:branched-chain amino acid transport system substrate-binding protein